MESQYSTSQPIPLTRVHRLSVYELFCRSCSIYLGISIMLNRGHCIRPLKVSHRRSQPCMNKEEVFCVPPGSLGQGKGRNCIRGALPMPAGGGLVLDGMHKFFMPRMSVIQRNGFAATWPKTACPISPAARVSTRQTMPAAGQRQRSANLSLFLSLAFHIPLLHALCAIDSSGPSGPCRAITFGPEIHCLLRDSGLSRTVASGSNVGASLNRSGKENIPTISTVFRA